MREWNTHSSQEDQDTNPKFQDKGSEELTSCRSHWCPEVERDGADGIVSGHGRRGCQYIWPAIERERDIEVERAHR